MKIEAGKRYVRRDGKVTGPIGVEGEGGDTDYPFYDDVFECTYTPHGVWKLNGEEHPQDLVMIYPEPPSQGSVEIKVLRAEVAELKTSMETLGKCVGAMQQTVMDMLSLVLALRVVAVSANLITDAKLDAMRNACRESAARRVAERHN